MLPVIHFQPGDRLKVPDGVYTTNENSGRTLVEVQVVQQYEHHVMVRKRKGKEKTRWCITNAEIYTLFSGRKKGVEHGETERN